MVNTRRASVALFLLAGSVLVLEVALTRVFSVMTWHHFAYGIISLAMLGFGAASSFLTVASRFSGTEVNGRLVARYALGFCLTTALGFATATKIRFHPTEIGQYQDYSNLFSLLLLYVVVGIPFFFAGVCIGYLISRAGKAINRLYFADLIGAGTGALLSLAGINIVGVEATIYGAAAAAGLVAVLYAVTDRRWGLRIASVLTLMFVVFLAGTASRRTILPVYFPPGKVPRESTMDPHYYKWHVVARVDVMNPRHGGWTFGGQFSPRHNALLKQYHTRGILQDGGAPTVIVHVPDGDVKNVPGLDCFLKSAPYVIKPNAPKVLVIGVGGGIDVLIALHHGAKDIVGAEINPVTVDVVKNRFADFAGRIFDRPDVKLIAAEGRHYVTTTDARFDVIQLSGVDSFTAQSMGAYALSENYLYTMEAIQEFWRHLAEDGLLSFSRWMRHPPREALRLVATELEALRRLGVEDPKQHFVVVAVTGGEMSWAESLLKESPFTREEVEAYRQWAERMGFQVLYDPFRNRENRFDRLIRASSARAKNLIESYIYNIRPTTDDDPFFFQFHRTPPSVERFVESWEERAGQTPRVPIAVTMLRLMFVQILVLSAAFILGPLWSRRSQLGLVPHKGRVLIYFAALGLGFILVEIAMLQKYSVFVGGPVYAMAVTLFAMLVFSGLGSLFSQWVGRVVPHALTVLLLLLSLGIIGEVMFANHVVPQLMYLPHTARCIVTVLVLAPLAMLMGMPFPMGIRVAQGLGQAIIPWAWGINAVATTLGALVCVLISMEWGFTTSLFTGAALYFIAMCLGLEKLSRPVALADVPVEPTST